MSQAAKNLPDPLQAATAESGPNADDILSQLAGEEIDRLLAEAESPRSEPILPAPPVTVAKSASISQPPPAVAPAQPAANRDINQQLDDLFNELNQETFEPAAPAKPAPAVPAALDQQLDDLFNELNQQAVVPDEPALTTAPETPESVLARPVPVEPPQPLVVEQSQAVVATATPAQVTTSLENDVLAATELAAIPEPPAKKEVAPLPKKQTEPEEPTPSPFFRPFVWLSSFFPETTLDWMGKVAILTTLNAMGIFAYILIRRH